SLPASERARLLSELGEAQEAAGELLDAQRSFRDALASDERCLPALWGLGRLCEPAGDSADRAALLEREAAILCDPGGRAECLRQAARLQDTAGNEPAAAALYQRVLELAPTDDEAFAELRRVYREASDFAALEELLRARMAATTNPPELVRLLG